MAIKVFKLPVVIGAKEKAEIVCFPESFIPGYRASDFAVEPHSDQKLKAGLEEAQQIAKGNRIAIILPMNAGASASNLTTLDKLAAS